jgi:4-diphosphocytidyl-2C-methyl-D-erythritol kinase
LDNDPYFRGCVEARAKLNLSLQVLGRRSDGFHDLKSVMTTLSLADRLSIEVHKINDEMFTQVAGPFKLGRLPWRVNVDVQSIPSNEGNICYRAAEMFFEHCGIDPSSVFVSILIEKNIPDAAGLGGGSANAAAVLRFLFQNQHRYKEWFNHSVHHLTLLELEQIARRCGADVPFCLYGGTRLCEGIGEVMTKLPPVFPAAVLLATPSQSVQTKSAFEMLDKFRGYDRSAARSLKSNVPTPNGMPLISSSRIQVRPLPCELAGEEAWKEAIALQSIQALEHLICNDFTPVIAGEIERVRQLLDTLKTTRAPVVSMSGSGPTCFALFNDLNECENVLASLMSRFPDVRFIKTTINSASEAL